MHNIINVVGLDADDVSSPYNCTELALPSSGAGAEQFAGGRRFSRQQRGEPELFVAASRPSRTGRKQRGDLKSVVHVAGLVFDASHALLQLSDGSVVHYLQHDQTGHPSLLHTPSSLCATCVDEDASFGSTNQNTKCMSLAQVGSQGMSLLAVSSFNEITTRGAIMLRALPGSSAATANENAKNVSRMRRYWGFNGLKKRRNKQTSASASAAKGAPSPVDGTPASTAKDGEQNTSVCVGPSCQITKRPSEECTELEHLDCTPGPGKKSHEINLFHKVSAAGLSPTIPEPSAKATRPSRSGKARLLEEALEMEPLDSKQPAKSVLKFVKNFTAIDPPGKKSPPEEGPGLVQTESPRAEPIQEPSATKGKKHLPFPSEVPAKVKCLPEEGTRLAHVVGQLESTPLPSTKSTKTPSASELNKPCCASNERPSDESPQSEQRSGHPTKNSPSEKNTSLTQIESTPVFTNEGSRKTDPVKEVTPGDLSPTSPSEPNIAIEESSQASKKRPSGGQMDTQLELIVQGYNQEPIHSPNRPHTDEKLNLNSNCLPTKKQKIGRDNRGVEDQKSPSVRKTPPSSPKRRSRKRSPPKSSTKSPPKTPPVKESISPADPESNRRHVGFLGMTIVKNKKTERKLPESCYQPNRRPPLLVEQLSNGNTSDRPACALTTVATEATTTSKCYKKHCDERQALAAKHRAEHEMLRNRVLHNIRYVLSTWDLELDSTRPHSSIVDSAKRWFEDSLVGHQEMLVSICGLP